MPVTPICRVCAGADPVAAPMKETVGTFRSSKQGRPHGEPRFRCSTGKMYSLVWLLFGRPGACVFARPGQRKGTHAGI